MPRDLRRVADDALRPLIQAAAREVLEQAAGLVRVQFFWLNEMALTLPEIRQ